MSRLLITNFSRGEFGPELYGRVDVPQYGAGAKRIRNFVIQRYGGVAFRPGFRVVKEFNPAERHRLIPFQYSMEQAYVLTLGNERMWIAAHGGMVTEEDLKITGATLAAQIVVEVAFHGYTVGDEVYIDGISGMTQLNGRFATVVAVPDANHITLDINSSGFSALTNSTGITRAGAPAPPLPPEPPPPAPTPEPTPPLTTPSEPIFDEFWWHTRGGMNGYYQRLEP